MENRSLDIGMPEGLDVVNRGSYRVIVRRWFTTATIFLTGFAVLWNGFLFVFYSAMGQAEEPPPLFFRLFPLGHVAVGIGVAYAALAGWLNRTRISYGQAEITVRQGPVPWRGNKTIPASNVKQLYSKERVTRSRNRSGASFAVHVITRDGRNIKLVGGLTSSEQALYIEQEIERRLRIEDVPVKGAL